MHRSHLKWLVVLSVITLCIAMFAWRTLGPRRGETSWGALTSKPGVVKVQYVDGQDVRDAQAKP